MANLRQQWSELSLEKKLSIAVVPLTVALIGALVPVLVARGGSGDAAPATSAASSAPASAPGLEVIDVAVGGGEVRGRGPTQLVDITIRNAGTLVSVVKRIGFRVRASELLTICQAGGGLEASATYDVLFPGETEPGTVLEQKVSQQIAPGEADRFTVHLDVKEPERQLGEHLYQLDVLLYHDTAREPLRAATVVVSVPSVPDEGYFWSAVPEAARPGYEQPAAGEVKQCLVDNESKYTRMLALDGERSPLLTLERTRAAG